MASVNYQSYLHNNNTRYLLAPSYIYSNNQQTWSSQFLNSKSQCIQHLNRIKQNIKRQEDTIIQYIKHYQQSIVKQLDSQYKELRAEIIKELDKTYEENKLKVKLGFDRENKNDNNQIIRDFKELGIKIDELLRELESQCVYKKGIAKTVLEDFENKRLRMRNKINQLEQKYSSDSLLKVEYSCYYKIITNIHNLFLYSGSSQLKYKSEKIREPVQQLNSFSNQRYNIQLSPPQQYSQNQYSPISNIRPPSFPSNPQFKKQLFSFQPNRVQQNNQNLRIQSSRSNQNQKLKQSSAQQFRNLFSQHFKQYIPNTQFVSSQVYPLSQPNVTNVNRHRNRDILKKKFSKI